jgi:branched-chain amino acid transport system ATP-binding protein
MNASPLLALEHVDTHYGPIPILQDVNIEIHAGEIVSLLGGNASGKSTTLKTILGLVRPTRGAVRFRGERIDGLPTGHVVARGISIVPENRRIFPEMTVLENLEMGAYLRHSGGAFGSGARRSFSPPWFVRRGSREGRDEAEEDMARVLDLFPRIGERLSQLGGTLSGGEQQMLAMGRALMSRPTLLLMDEPSMGLAPLLVERVFELIQRINEQGTTILMVEQNARVALSIADRGYVLQTGRLALADSAQNLLDNEMMQQAYLGTACE